MSATDEPISIETRVAELERLTKRLKKDNRIQEIQFVIFVIGVFVIGGLYFYQQRHLGLCTDGIVRASILEIVDGNDQTRVRLGTDSDGGVHWTLHDTSGRVRFEAAQVGERVDLRLTDYDQRRVGLCAMDSGGHMLYFIDRDNTERIVLSRDAAGGACLALQSPQGKGGVLVSTCEAGAAGLVVVDAAEVPRFLSGICNDGTPTLNFSDENGQTRLLLGESSESGPALDMLASDGTTRASLRAQDDWSCLTLCGDEERAWAKMWVDQSNDARAAFSDAFGKLYWSSPPEFYIWLTRQLKTSGYEPPAE